MRIAVVPRGEYIEFTGYGIIESPVPNSLITALGGGQFWAVASQDICTIHDKQSLELLYKVRLARGGCNSLYCGVDCLYYRCEERLYSVGLDYLTQHFAFGPTLGMDGLSGRVIDPAGQTYYTSNGCELQEEIEYYPIVEQTDIRCWDGVIWSSHYNQYDIQHNRHIVSSILILDCNKAMDYVIYDNGDLYRWSNLQGKYVHHDKEIYAGSVLTVSTDNMSSYRMLPLRGDGVIITNEGSSGQIELEDLDDVELGLFNLIPQPSSKSTGS